MATNVMNAQILDALRVLGFVPKDADFPSTGAQSTTFPTRLAARGVTPEQFGQALEFARAMVDRGVPASVMEEFKQTPLDQRRGPGLANTPMSLFRQIAERQLADGRDPTKINNFRSAIAKYETSTPKPVEPVARQAPSAGSGPGARGQGDTRQIVPAIPPPTAPPLTAGALGPPPGPTAPAAPAAATLPPPPPVNPADVLDIIQARYGWGAALNDVPDVKAILDQVAAGRLSAEDADRQFRGTQFFKTTTTAERTWKMRLATDPADAARDRQLQRDNVLGVIAGTGADPATIRVDELVELSLRFGWTPKEVNRFIAAEMRYDPAGIKTGTLKQLKDIKREWLVPLSDAAMTQWAQSVVGGTKTTEEFTEYLRGQAKSLFPALGTALDDPNVTTRGYLSPIGETVAGTLGMNANDIDWEDPKFMRFINTVDQKTNQRMVMPLADVKRTIMADPQYQWDKTENGRQQKMALGRSLLEKFGFGAPGGEGGFG